MRRKQTGFTLLESLVVVALLALTLLAVPPLVQWLNRQGVAHAVQQLQTDLQLARLMAVNRQRTCRIAFNLPLANQYLNLLDGRMCDLSVYRGGAHFLATGPDGMKMAKRIEFNGRGMSTTVAPIDIFVADGDNTRIYRLRVMLPGGVSRYVWQDGQWH